MREGYTDLRSAAELALVAARHALNAEISSYPKPISGCDAQFNHLLAERYRLNDALGALSADVPIITPRALTPHSGIESR